MRHVGAVGLVMVAGTSTPAWAIPSPEIVVGSLASLSQLVALGTALLGGGALAVGTRIGGRDDGAAAQRLKRLLGAMGLIALAALALNAYQFISAREERRARLEASLLRPTPKASDGTTLDPQLREIPYREQVSHPLGLTTEDAEALVTGILSGARPDWMILDIRETAETEMGSFPKAVKIRFPDLSKFHDALQNRKALLICHNGNRSAETCAALAAQGIDCRFIRGGLEKWLVEGRRMEGLMARSVDELRAIPDYPNHQTLLDTAAVKALVEADRAIFLDVRYPGEFASQHLPGAINLSLRSTPTEEIKRRLGELPRRPVVVPCYDRRSCFFGEIVGLELTRSGHDYRGRYTVPWEYFVPAPRPAHVEAWLAQSQQGTWSNAATSLAGLLMAAAGHVGLVAALALLSLASRLIILPFAVKAERDQIAARAMSVELHAIKAKHATDPARLARAVSDLYRRNGLTPGRNLIAILFLPVLALSVEAAIEAARGRPEPFLWLNSLADNDWTLLLPITFAGLLCLYVHVALTDARIHRMACWLGLAPLLVAAGAMLPAAANLYVIFSALLLLGQRAIVGGMIGRLSTKVRAAMIARQGARLGHPGLVATREPERLGAAGNKAYRLAVLAQHGLPVPHGVVLTEPFLKVFASADEFERRRYARRIWRFVRAGTVAVRSSASVEDGASTSFAGVFESEINVRRAGFVPAIARVLDSFSAAKASSYSQAAGDRNILVQPMVNAALSGVLFTEDPEAPGILLIESIDGLADQLVSGRVTPKSFRFGRVTRKLIGAAAVPPVDFAPLMTMAIEAERIFGGPQDIEWAYARGGFQILQCRDITTAQMTPVTREWRRLALLAAGSEAAQVVLERTAMSEMLPRPTPLSLSLLEDLWASGGSVDRALRHLGIAYPISESSAPLHAIAFGRLYVDKREEARRSPRLSALALRRIRKAASDIETSYRQTFLPEFLAEMRLMDAVALDRLDRSEVLAHFSRIRRRFVTETHAHAEVINVAAQIYLDDARRALEAVDADAIALLRHIPQTEPARAVEAAMRAPADMRDEMIVRAIGHRSALDYELAEPRYAEDPERLARAAAAVLRSGHQGADAELVPSLCALAPSLRGAVERARSFQTLKEDAKHHALRELAQLRRLALEIGRRTDLSDLVFQLTGDEIEQLDEARVKDVRGRAADRSAARDVLLAAAPLAARLDARDLERGPLPVDVGAAAANGNIKGVRVSGSGIVEGRAVVLDTATAEAGAPIGHFLAGDILVAPMIHPAWLPEIIRAGGAVAEIGGWLSHMSIIAREHGIAMIVGVTGLAGITNGAWLRLHPDGRIELPDSGDIAGAEAAGAE